MKLKRLITILFAFFLIFGWSNSFASMTSTNYQIQWDEINIGGSDIGSSTSYILRDSIGSVGDISSESTNYQNDAGYRAGVYDRTAEFSLYIQNTSTEVGASALSSNTVTVTSASGFEVGDLIGVIQDNGDSEVIAIGEIASIISTDLTVDEWTTNGTTPTIDGTNDMVYELNGTSLSFGVINSSTVSTAFVGWKVSADVDSGYSVYIKEDQNLDNGNSDIPDVIDGDVSAGSSEYGARSSDTTLASSTFDTQDTGITSTYQQIASRSGNSFSTRDFLELKVSMVGGQESGTYTQTLTIMYVGDY